MKFYWRDPDAAFAGMAGLTLEQIGAYNLVLDRLYALDGVLPDNDADLAHAFHLDIRLWRRVKRELMAAGKLRSEAGMLEANGVRSRLLLANIRSTSAKHAADVRWKNERKRKEINDAAMQARNASKTKNIEEERSWAVNSGDNSEGGDDDFGVVEPKRHPLSASPALQAVMRAKGRR